MGFKLRVRSGLKMPRVLNAWYEKLKLGYEMSGIPEKKQFVCTAFVENMQAREELDLGSPLYLR